MPVRGIQMLVRHNYLLGLSILLIVSLISVAFSLTGSDDFEIARREVMLRRIGHEVLLQSGDSTSRVLPVKKVSKNEYQVSFEKPLTFHPEYLVKTTQRLLAKDPLGTDYVVNVLNCTDASVAYGYAISKNGKDDIVSCIGRTQPLSCYVIDIKFKSSGMTMATNGYILGALMVLAVGGMLYWRSRKVPEGSSEVQVSGMFNLGSMSFDAEGRKLMANGQIMDLTRTEARVLHIFALSPNEIIERSRLQKEIWEDEGVIVGRSLDMFISKLRKKLEVDPNVRIVVIRSKGYKLEINA